MTFTAKWLAGHIQDWHLEDALLDEIDAWHGERFANVSLYQWLGWSSSEYRRWVEDPSVLRDILMQYGSNSPGLGMDKRA